MITDSRKAQRNSYAHHRAHLLFAGLAQHSTPHVGRLSALSDTDMPTLNKRVRAGLIGFVPKGAATRVDRGMSSYA